MTQKSRTDTCWVFKLGSKVGHVTRHEQQLFKVKRLKFKVTKSRDVAKSPKFCTLIGNRGRGVGGSNGSV